MPFRECSVCAPSQRVLCCSMVVYGYLIERRANTGRVFFSLLAALLVAKSFSSRSCHDRFVFFWLHVREHLCDTAYMCKGVCMLRKHFMFVWAN